jgi:anti-sigma-K factor RskA
MSQQQMSSIDQSFKLYRQFITAIVATTIVSLALNSTFAQEKSDEELVKELSNPVASLISVPFRAISNLSLDRTMTVLSTR